MKKFVSTVTLVLFLAAVVLSGSVGVSAATPAGTILYESNFAECKAFEDTKLKYYDANKIDTIKFENGKLIFDNTANNSDVFMTFDPSIKLPAGVDQFTMTYEYSYLEGTGTTRYITPLFFFRDDRNYSGTWLRFNNIFVVDVRTTTVPNVAEYTHYDDLGEFSLDDRGIKAGAATHKTKLIYDKGLVSVYIDDVLIGRGRNPNETPEGEFGIMVKMQCNVELANFMIYTGIGEPLRPTTGGETPVQTTQPNTQGPTQVMGGGTGTTAPPMGDAGMILLFAAAIISAAGIVVIRRKVGR